MFQRPFVNLIVKSNLNIFYIKKIMHNNIVHLFNKKNVYT